MSLALLVLEIQLALTAVFVCNVCCGIYVWRHIIDGFVIRDADEDLGTCACER